MAVMELHKHLAADEHVDSHVYAQPRDGEPDAPVNAIVELVSEPPQTHVFSSQYVDAETKNGWLRFEGEPVSYSVAPDPNGEMKLASSLELTLPGDKLVLHVYRDGQPVQVVYRVTHYPVPRFFRLADDGEQDGVRIAPEYGLELEEVRGG